jgi:peptide/nickel transport system ATP-binding protein
LILLDVQNLTISFRTPRGVLPVVEGISFQLAESEILGLVGESGSGKSLTALSVMRLITDPNAIITGKILFKGEDILALKEPAMRRLRGGAMAMIFQDPMTALTPVYTIGAQIVEQIRSHTKLPTWQARLRAESLLAAMGIADAQQISRRFPHQLSGGMRQRVMIAMALSCSPALLIADEPTTALDVTVQAEILELLLKLRREFNSSILLITHDMGIVAQTADRVAVMYAGRIAESGATRDIFAHPMHPYTIGLLEAIPQLHGPRVNAFSAIPGAPPAPHEKAAGCAFAPRCAYRIAVCAERPPLLDGPFRQVACFRAGEVA